MGRFKSLYKSEIDRIKFLVEKYRRLAKLKLIRINTDKDSLNVHTEVYLLVLRVNFLC